MLRYIGKRLLVMIPTILGVLLVVFFILELTPGNPGQIILGPTASPEAIEAMNKELGADLPFVQRLGRYLINLLQGDLGNSYRSKAPVLKEILARFPTTLIVACLGVVFSTLLGVSMGILSAVKQYSLTDNFLTVVAIFFACIPGFWLGFMLILFFGVNLGWLPTSGLGTWKHFVLPIVVLTCSGSASLMRITRTAMLDTIRQDYVRTARGKGAQENVVIWRHALRNALMPVVTVIGGEFGGLLGGTIILESVFALPGLGQYLVQAILSKDAPVVLSTTFFLSILFCLVVLITDLVYALIDPRVRNRYTKN